ncbi:MAG: hypothetical protein O2968_01045 [Acidobacteria bacterium]|nr:hypothetical protein [Acidobacteriota bacterium]
MSRREEWRKVLASEMECWSAKSCEQLIAELGELQAYEVEFDSKTYQVEVVLLEDTEEYVHVLVAIDDTSLRGFIRPEGDSFICRKVLER